MVFVANLGVCVSTLLVLSSSLLLMTSHSIVEAWKSRECPIDSQDNRETYLCMRPCDYDGSDHIGDEGFISTNRFDHARNLKQQQPPESSSNQSGSSEGSEDDFFIVFFPPKNVNYEKTRFKCPSGFKQTKENGQCFCERPYTPYELEMQRREKCDQAFERCRMYGSKPYDCNHIIDSCPAYLIREYCLAGKVFKMRFARVIYEFCHSFLRLPVDGRQKLEPHIDRQKQ